VRSTSSSEPGALLLYDGSCGLCAASVRFVLEHERQQSLQFAPLQGETGEAVRARHPALRAVDSMIWVEGSTEGRERVFLRSAAALRVARYVGGPWAALAVAASLVPRFIADAVYDAIARHRHQLVSKDRCFLPPPSVRARFLA
jgi:predicted DCC family thiol-disulfide oxidoreductase YuxK